ncbi:NDUFS6 (predicted) [Pycnogonum litorale]
MSSVIKCTKHFLGRNYANRLVCSAYSTGYFHFPKDDKADIKKAIEPEEKMTHTGQQWDKSDYRLARYVDKGKEINERFAIDLIAEQPPIPVKERVTSCDGGGGPLGHPKVYINVDQEGYHSCGYCGLRFYHEHNDDK